MSTHKSHNVTIECKRTKMNVGFFVVKLGFFFFLFECMKCGRLNRNQNASIYSTTVWGKNCVCSQLGSYESEARARWNFQQHTNINTFTCISTGHTYTHAQREKKHSRPYIRSYSFFPLTAQIALSQPFFFPHNNTVCVSLTHTQTNGRAHIYATTTTVKRKYGTE